MAALRNSLPRRRDRGDDEQERLLSRLRADCGHFRNFDFRAAVSHRLITSGTLDAIAQRSYRMPSGQMSIPFGGAGGTLKTEAYRSTRPSGIACAGRRCPHLEVHVDSALDAAVSLQDGAQSRPLCLKPAVVFAAHPSSSPPDGRGICLEEEELLGRSTWSEAFFSIETGAGPCGEPPCVEALPERCGPRYLEARAPDCLVAENVWLLRHNADDAGGLPGAWRQEPRELGAVVCFLPQRQPELIGAAPPPGAMMPARSVPRSSDPRSIYAAKADRASLRAQVDAALRACCLLDCDGLVVGCAEGICGSEVFGHPLGEVAEVWRDAIEAHSGQFRRVAFALGKATPSNLRGTGRLLSEIVGAQLFEQD